MPNVGSAKARHLALALAMLAAGTPRLAAAPPSPAKPERIVVVSDDNYPPYVFRDESGRVQGVVPDQWKAWEEATGVAVEFRAMDWAAAQAEMRAGRADVIDTMFVNGERLALYDFTRPYADIEVPVFIHKSISGIASAGDLRGFRVGVKAGDASIPELRSRGVTELVEYPSYEAIVEAAAAGEVRVFCVDKPPAYYFLYKRGVDEQFRVAFSLGGGQFHRAVGKGDRSLLALVQEGFDQVPRARYAAIDRTWFGSSLRRSADPALVRAVVIAVLALFLLAAFFASSALTLRARVRKATAEIRAKLKLLEASEARNRAFIAALPDIFFVLDAEGVYHEIGTHNPELLALPLEQLMGKRISELAYGPGSAEALLASVRRVIRERRTEVVEYEIEVQAGLRRFEGKLVPLGEDRALLVPRDITDRAAHEALLKANVREKEMLIREVHHRVKNNLQIISSLIALQEGLFRDTHDRALLEETQNRIRAMARLHELLYSSQDSSAVDAAEYLDSISRGLAEGSDVPLDFSASPLLIGLDHAVPMGLIVTELVTNALKYACPLGRCDPIEVELRIEGGDCVMRVADKGPGLPPGFDPEASPGLGYTLVSSLVAQLRGRLELSEGPHLAVTIRFPLPTSG